MFFMIVVQKVTPSENLTVVDVIQLETNWLYISIKKWKMMLIFVLFYEIPSATPSYVPTTVPTAAPTHVPSVVPTNLPSRVPSVTPTFVPSTVTFFGIDYCHFFWQESVCLVIFFSQNHKSFSGLFHFAHIKSNLFARKQFCSKINFWWYFWPDLVKI